MTPNAWSSILAGPTTLTLGASNSFTPSDLVKRWRGTFDYQLVKLTIEWKAPARFDQVIELSIFTTHLGNTSFTVVTEFRIAGREQVICKAETIYVNVDSKTLTKVPLSLEVRTALQSGAPGKIVDHAGRPIV